MTGYEVAEAPARVWVLSPYFKHQKQGRSASKELEEALALAHALPVEVVGGDTVNIAAVGASHYIGTGKAIEICELAKANDIEIVVVNTSLAPIQQRNLEKAFQCKVIDRVQLILEIFGDRARTREGRLQVELAMQHYQKSRLVRSWTHLERQRGGAGFLGGPGERQIELDRRMIQDRIVVLSKLIEKVRTTRRLHRKQRKAAPYPVVALVGYTNAGKSTLFNHVTGADVFAKDQLFATLDPTLRHWKLPSGRKVMLSDTVGFISNLPTELIAAFRATLEEVLEADVIIHVRDIASDDSEQQALDVHTVMGELGVREGTDAQQMIEVWNKADALPSDQHDILREKALNSKEPTILTSAVEGTGLHALGVRVEEMVQEVERGMRLILGAHQAEWLSWMHRHGHVLDVDWDSGKADVRVRLTQEKRGKLMKYLAQKAA